MCSVNNVQEHNTFLSRSFQPNGCNIWYGDIMRREEGYMGISVNGDGCVGEEKERKNEEEMDGQHQERLYRH